MSTNLKYACTLKFETFGLFACCLFFFSCSPCDQEKGQEIISPNKALTASIVYVGCGAIAKDATWVTLHGTGDKYDRKEDIVFTAVQQQRLEVTWIDNQHLSIYCRCHQDDVRFQVIKKGNINITYN